MKNRRKLIPTLIAAALLALCLPALAAAQGSYDQWGRDNGRNRRDDYYGRDNRRAVRDAVRRAHDRSDDFKYHLDSTLDRSRYDGTRREDNINQRARDFQDAADRLKDRFDDGRNLNRSADEARRLLQIGSDINRFMSRNRLDGRAESDWSQISQDLRVIADAYNPRYNEYGGYGRDDDYRRRRDNPRTNNNDPWRQLP